jgi:cytochrome c556
VQANIILSKSLADQRNQISILQDSVACIEAQNQKTSDDMHQDLQELQGEIDEVRSEMQQIGNSIKS